MEPANRSHPISHNSGLTLRFHGANFNETWRAEHKHNYIRVMSHANESRHSFEWVMARTFEWVRAHIWMSHGAPIWMRHGAYLKESWHTFEWVMARIWTKHGVQDVNTLLYTSHVTYKWTMTLFAMSHVTHLNEWWFTFELDTAYRIYT